MCFMSVFRLCRNREACRAGVRFLAGRLLGNVLPVAGQVCLRAGRLASLAPRLAGCARAVCLRAVGRSSAGAFRSACRCSASLVAMWWVVVY